ncbi:acetyl-CoA synthetase-like protein [Xylaria bambusicola]|uniref:acetyl-CoA synthetase-like protein n=1 Tax=Xylaria bambusicola TaxID=326684 RepID=UPI002008CD21|nr:acetyl-CoA synthetase-like protein [Xylaria bambusicola]KAI0515106.1 acetyl-CoA synthetase-like protein [Xylaria bambusicola]
MASELNPATKRSGQDGLSIVHGRRDIPLEELDIGHLIKNQARLYRDRPAIIGPYPKALTRWTYGQLEENSNALARALMAAGVSKGDRVGIFAGNRLEYCALLFAAGRIGAILVVYNATYTPSELHKALKHTECKVLFLSTDMGRGDDSAYFKCVHDATDLPTLQTIVLLDEDGHGTKARCTHYQQFLRGSARISEGALRAAEQKVNPHDVLNLQFTSGTTGNPKAVMLTHHGLINNGRITGRIMGLGASDVLSCPMPMYHLSGLGIGLFATLTHGAAVVFPRQFFDPLAVIHSVQREHCTALFGVPTMWVAFLQHLKPGWDFSGVKTGISGGASVPRPLMEDIQKKLKVKDFVVLYGMTETSPVAFITRRSDSVEKQLTTVGQVLPHTSAKIVDAEGQIVPIGQRGEVCFAGYLLQKGYWKDKEQTAKAMKRDQSGVLWMHSGDEGLLDEDGYCAITGRIKDIIIRGGENIYPLEIEERLMQHPAIASAAVIGVKDAKYGETVGAFLESRQGAAKIEPEEIRAWVRRELAYHKAPVHVFWVGKGGSLESFPVTGSGKVQKEKLREIANSPVKGIQKSSKI